MSKPVSPSRRMARAAERVAPEVAAAAPAAHAARTSLTPAQPFERAPASGWRAWPRQSLMLLVRGYRLFLSPWLGSSCRFEPSCSRYALQALERHGAAAGSYLTARRLLRCHPWCAAGFDAVPHERPRLFRHLFAEATGPAPQPEPAAALSEPPIASRPLP